MVLIRRESETDRDGQIVTTSEFCDLTNIPETCSHHNCLIAMLLVVVEDCLDALDARVLLRTVILLRRGLVPIKNAADKR